MRRIAALVLVALAAVVISVVALGHRASAAGAAEARRELAASLRSLSAGNYSAARNHAQGAVRADPSWGLAHALLARTYLATGDGVAAEGELGRAREAGFDMARAHQLLAQAYLLQGDADSAIAEAGQAPPRYGTYAARVIARAEGVQRRFPQAEALLARVLAANDGNGAAWSDLAQLRYDAGDLGGATQAADRAIKLDPANLEALTLRAELVRAQYGLTASLPWFEAVLQRDAYYVPALLHYAATLGEAGRNSDMLAATRKALLARPGNADALYLQAVMAARAGDYELARGLLGRTRGALSQLPGALLLAGALDYARGADAQAVDEWRGVLARQPLNLTARRLAGAALLRSGDPNAALAMLKPLALRSDADSYTLLVAARAFERIGARDWASRLLDRAASPAMAPPTGFGSDEDFDALRASAGAAPDPGRTIPLIRGLIDRKNFADALAAAQGLARAQPGAPDGQVLLGDVLLLSGKAGEAADAYRRAADLRFDQPTALRLIDALDRAGRRDAAARVLATYLSQNPADVAAHRLAAHWQVAAGQWDDAIDTLEELRDRIGDRDPLLLTELATAYLGADDADTARAYAQAAYRLVPMSAAASDTYGWALYQLGEVSGALELLRKAAALAPGHAGISWHYAQVLADVGRDGEAKAAITEALRDPAFPDRAAAQKLLATLK